MKCHLLYPCYLVFPPYYSLLFLTMSLSFPKLSPFPLSLFSSHILLLYLLFLISFLIILPPLFHSSYVSAAFLPLGDPLQFPGDSGGTGKADVQRSSWRRGGLVRFPSCLPLLPHPFRWNGPACVDGYFHWCSQGTPAQRTAQMRSG